VTVSRTLIKIVALVIFLAWVMGRGATPAFADIVEFGEINSLQGSIISFEKGVLIFSTTHVKRIRIPADHIRSISTDRVITIKMKDDSILTGTLTTLEDGQVAVILGPDGELVPLDWSQVKTINPPPDKWTGDIALGGNTKSGNTNSTTINLSFGAQRQWGRNRLSVHFRFNFEEEEGNVTARDSYTSIKYDHFFTGRDIFAGLSLEGVKDEFKDIQLQLITGLGLGYRFWNDEEKKLELQAGVAFFSDNRILGTDSEFMTGRLSFTFSYTFFTYFSIENISLFFPSFKNSDQRKIRSESSLISRLGTGWSVKLTYILDQDSLSGEVPGIEDVDNRFIFAIQYSF
jgi:putative salt-induced outer membrane protein YdiY